MFMEETLTGLVFSFDAHISNTSFLSVSWYLSCFYDDEFILVLDGLSDTVGKGNLPAEQ